MAALTTTSLSNATICSNGSDRRRRLAAGALAGVLGVGLIAFADPAAATARADEPMRPTVVATEDEVEAALDRLRADGMLLDPFAVTDDDLATARAPGMAAQFGLSFFRGLIQGGGLGAFQFALGELGFDPTGQMSAIREIGASIDDLNAEVQALSQQIESVLEGQDRANFYASYSAAGQASSRLSVALRSVHGWMEAGANPSAANVSDLQTVVRTSVADLAFQVANPTTGAIPLMMRAAEPAAVSDLDTYWHAIDTVRTDYRAVLAQGLTTLELLQEWDYTGTVAADLVALTPVASDTVLASYEFGLQAVTPQDTKALFVRDHHGAYAPAQDVGNGMATPWRQVYAGAGTRTFLDELASSYAPHHHDGATLEDWLRSRNMPTGFVEAYSVETEETRRSTHWVNLREVVHQERVRVSSVQGNHVTHEWMSLDEERVAWTERGYVVNGSVVWKTYQGDPAAAAAQAQTERAAWHSAIEGHTPRWTAHSDARAKVLYLNVPLNVGGFSADVNPDRVRAAAFG